MPTPDSPGHDKLIQFLGRFVPVVGRGLALGFGALAVATAFFGMGDYASAADRYSISTVYAFVAVVALVVSRAVGPILRRIGGKR